jgi:hypothetical protein
MEIVKISRISNGFIVEKDGKFEYQKNLDELFEKMKNNTINKFSNYRTNYEFTYEIKEIKNEG